MTLSPSTSVMRTATRKTVRGIVAAACVACAGACGGQSLDVGYDDARVSNVNPAAPVDLGAVARRCAATPSAPEPETGLAARALLDGRWFLCEASDPTAPAAIELLPSGQFFALVPDGANVFSRDASRQGTFSWGKDLSCCYPDTFVLAFGPDIRATPSYLVTFAGGPLEMKWAPGTAHGSMPRPVVARFIKG